MRTASPYTRYGNPPVRRPHRRKARKHPKSLGFLSKEIGVIFPILAFLPRNDCLPAIALHIALFMIIAIASSFSKS